MTDYTSTRVEDYNDDPAPDNGTTVSANQITWAGIKTELFDPINTAISSIDTEVDTSFTSIPALVGTKHVDYPAKDWCGTASGAYTSGNTRVFYWQLDNGSADDNVWLPIVMPDNWDNGEVTVYPRFINYNGGTNTGIRMNLTTLVLESGDAIGGTYSTGVSATYTLASAAAGYVILGAGMADTPTYTAETDLSGKLVIFRLTRDYGHGDDDYSTTIGFAGAYLSYTTDAVIEE